NVHVYKTAIGLLYVRTEAPTARSFLARLFWSHRRLNLLRCQALTCEYLGELGLSDQRWTSAYHWLTRAVRMGQQWEMWDVVGEASCRLAEWELAHRRPAAALTRVEACLADFERMSDVYEIAVCRRVRGQTLVALGRVQEAIRDFDLAL